MAKGRKGRKNLVTTSDGMIRNQHGVKFTTEEKKKLESLYSSVMRKRREQIKEYEKLPRLVGGKETGDTLATKLQSGFKDDDFIITKKTKSLQRFRNKSDYNRYIKYLERVKSGEYLDDRTRLWKKNYVKAIENVHGKEAAKDITNKIRSMRLKDFRKMAEQDELVDIAHVYLESDKVVARAELRKIFNVKQVDEDGYYNEEDEV